MDWVKRGWGKDYSSEFSPDLQYHISFPKEIKQDWQTASKQAIDKIIKAYPAPYNLLASGGVDSQAMLWMWIKSGVKFVPTFVKYMHKGKWLNEHDFISLEKFITNNNLQIRFIEFDILQFLTTELYQYAEEYYCNSPQITSYMRMTEDLPGTVIFSGNFKSDFTYSLEQLGVMFYADITERNIIPFFLMYSNELANSIETHPPKGKPSAASFKRLKEVDSIEIPDYIPKSEFHKTRYKNNLYKALCLIDEGFPITLPDTKYSGFEGLKDECELLHFSNANRSQLKTMKSNSLRLSKRKFDIEFTYPLQDAFPHISQVIYIQETVDKTVKEIEPPYKLSDLHLLLSLVDKASERGVFKASELAHVDMVYNKIYCFLNNIK